MFNFMLQTWNQPLSEKLIKEYTWSGEWDGGSYQIEYYEIMTDASLSTLINLHHARQLRKEYTSDKKSPANEPPDGNSFVLTYYNVYSDKEETLFNDPYTGHILTYSSNSDYGIHSPRKREQTNKRTYTGGERVRVGDGRYSKGIYKSFGYMNADTKPLKAWHYKSNPCDSWSLEIIATREQAGELLYKIDNSIKLKEDKAFRCNIK